MSTISLKSKGAPHSQLEFDGTRFKEADRNAHLGGRSFYFFDFDDNVAFLTTPLILFAKQTGLELAITSGEFAREHAQIGIAGPYKDYEIRLDDTQGTFRNFRDHDEDQLRLLGLQRQIFHADVLTALAGTEFSWKGPSWSCFYHATFNQRPISVITARGHSPHTLKEGIDLFVDAGHLPERPNYLSIYPVNHAQVRQELGDLDGKMSTAHLKQAAIRASVLRAIQIYGYSAHHRFGMSDDDPKNIELITDEMIRLKSEFPEMKFFMIETHKGDFVKHEISLSGLRAQRLTAQEAKQILLFPESESAT